MPPPPQRDIFVAVPSYNHAPYIEECLRSIFDQTVYPKKLLVIDDGSKDDSVRVIERVLRDCPFDSELISRENRGLCNTLNQGFELSSGRYFAYIGSDDYWMPQFLERRFEMLEARPNAVLGYGHANLIDDDGKIFDSTTRHTSTWGNFPDGYARQMVIEGRSPISSTVFYRSSALEKVSWRPDARLEDFEMYINLVELGEFAFDPAVLSVWRDHSSNTSKDVDMLMDEVIAALRRNRDILRLTDEELHSAESRVRFHRARVMLQHGYKADAARLAVKNSHGASSLGEIASFWARMCVPMPLVRWRRSGRRSRS